MTLGPARAPLPIAKRDPGTLPFSPTPCLDAPSTPMTDHLHLRAQRLLPAFLATGMSAFVAAVVTAVNTGIDGGFMLRWAYAWTLALPSAIVAAYLFRPLAWRAAMALARSRLLSPRTPGTR